MGSMTNRMLTTVLPQQVPCRARMQDFRTDIERRNELKTKRQLLTYYSPSFYFITHTLSVPVTLCFVFTITFVYAALNANLRVSLLVKTEGWTDITSWRAVGVINGLYKADAGISKTGQFLPSQEGVCLAMPFVVLCMLDIDA